MGKLRVAQEAVEVATIDPSALRQAMVVVEVAGAVITTPPEARLAQEVVEAAAISDAQGRAAQVAVEVMVPHACP